MGGEKQISFHSLEESAGSPPHGRGKAAAIIFALASMGITPAWAGKSLILSLEKPMLWDHPRMGGEKRPSWSYGVC